MHNIKYCTNILLVGKLKGNRILGRSRCRWEDFIKTVNKIDLKKWTSVKGLAVEMCFCTKGDEMLPQQLDITCAADKISECEEGSYSLGLIGL